jgi:glycosyltransferase involved in cell wall biosynthesis
MKVTLFRDLPTEGWPSMERYADELTAALRELGCAAQPFVAARPLPQVRGRIGALANYAWRTSVYPFIARTRQGDVNHILDHSYAHLIYALDARRTIVTCHDIAPLALDQRGQGLSRRLWDYSFQAMIQAAHILTDSAHTRSEILRRTNYPAQRITVAPLGVSASFFNPLSKSEAENLRKRHQLGERPVVLHVGSCQPRKNVEVIFQALAQLLDLDPILVQVGGQFSPRQVTLIASLDLHSRIKQIGAVSEDELHAWYQATNVLVFPSLYEGFGLPVLEAMASGTPVVCANTSSLPEVAGEAALLIDPHDSQALANAIRTAVTDSTLRRSLIEKGIARSREFTWEQTARRTLQVYISVHQSL